LQRFLLTFKCDSKKFHKDKSEHIKMKISLYLL
jgi:hypothetical protein